MTEAKDTNKDGKAQSSSEPKMEMEKLLGESLLTPVSKAKAKKGAFIKKPTRDLLSLKEKDFVLVYYAAKSSGPCQEFTPQLIEFYKLNAKEGRFEIVFVSSDKTDEEFNQHFGSMPWLAMPRGSEFGDELYKRMRVRQLPSLALLQNKTGFFVTAKLQDDFKKLEKMEDGMKLVDHWKTRKALPIDEGSSKEFKATIMGFLFEAFQTGVLIFAALNVYNFVLKYMNSSGKISSSDGDGSGGGEL